MMQKSPVNKESLHIMVNQIFLGSLPAPHPLPYPPFPPALSTTFLLQTANSTRGLNICHPAAHP